MIKADIEKDTKEAMLAGDKTRVSTLRTLKGVILDEEVKLGKRDAGLSDDEIVGLLLKEKKKRAESAKIYQDAGDTTRFDEETAEIEVISKYLPEMMDEEAIRKIVCEIIDNRTDVTLAQMGQIIGEVKSKAGPSAEGAVIAKVAKEEISKVGQQ